MDHTLKLGRVLFVINRNTWAPMGLHLPTTRFTNEVVPDLGRFITLRLGSIYISLIISV